MTLSGRIVCLVVAALVAAGGVRAQTPRVPDRPVPGEARARLIERRVRIEPTRTAPPGVCSSLGADDLVVRLRGRPVDPGRVELLRERGRTLHALLIDTSGSMVGKLDFVREAARGYVAQIRPDRDRAMVMTFDDAVVLVQGPTADRGRIDAAIDGFRMGASTSMLDGLHEGIREVRGHRERPVLVLLTDGMDTASLHERGDVLRLAKQVPGLTVFTIGLALPGIGGPGPTGLASTRKFLQLLASGTNGAFFDSPTASRLPRIYGRIRELLESEATLTVMDPDPYEAAGALKVRSRVRGCRVRVYDERRGDGLSKREPIEVPASGLPHATGLEPDPAFFRLYTGGNRKSLEDPVCRIRSGDTVREERRGWFVRAEPGRVRACGLDVTLERGLLYTPFEVYRAAGNSWLELRNRVFDIPLPPIEDLPGRPAELLDGIAATVLAAADRRVEIHPLRKPGKLHARPYHDVPSLANGVAFFDLRPKIAGAMFLQPEYGEWARARLEREAQEDLATLRERMRHIAGEVASEETIDALVRESDEGRRIRERAETPTEVDVTAHLAAWLGDVPAHDLFARWEAIRIDRLVEAGAPAEAVDRFVVEWAALRRLFFAPSYARVLTLVSPVHDRDTDRIGFYRVILPRPGWLLPRVQNLERHPEHADLPLDLVPDLPLGLWAVGELVSANPGLAGRFSESGLRVESVAYELLGRRRKHDPRRAFRHSRVTVTLGAPTTSPTRARLVLVAETRLSGEDRNEPVLESIDVSAEGDPVLERLTLPAVARTVPERRSRTGSP